MNLVDLCDSATHELWKSHGRKPSVGKGHPDSIRMFTLGTKYSLMYEGSVEIVEKREKQGLVVRAHSPRHLGG